MKYLPLTLIASIFGMNVGLPGGGGFLLGSQRGQLALGHAYIERPGADQIELGVVVRHEERLCLLAVDDELPLVHPLDATLLQRAHDYVVLPQLRNLLFQVGEDAGFALFALVGNGSHALSIYRRSPQDQQYQEEGDLTKFHYTEMLVMERVYACRRPRPGVRPLSTLNPA